MSAAIVDASAALALALSQSGAAAVRATLARWRQEQVAVHVPSHFWLEFANVLVRRYRWESRRVIAAVHALDDFALETVELSRPLLLLALDLAERHGLSMYDAAYLALAETVDGQLLTADERLLAAAGPRAVIVPGGEHRLSEGRPPYSPTQPSWPRYRNASAYLARLRSEATR